MSKEKKKTIIFTIILIVIAATLIGLLVFDRLKENGNITNSEVKEIMQKFDKY